MHAETGQPFPEHKSKERDEDRKLKMCVEVKPDVECKIEVTSKHKEPTVYNVEIDRRSLGCRWELDKKRVHGSFRDPRDTALTNRAFRFAKPPRMRVGAHSNGTTAWTGKIVVSFFRRVKLKRSETLKLKRLETAQHCAAKEWKEGEVFPADNVEAKSIKRNQNCSRQGFE